MTGFLGKNVDAIENLQLLVTINPSQSVRNNCWEWLSTICHLFWTIDCNNNQIWSTDMYKVQESAKSSKTRQSCHCTEARVPQKLNQKPLLNIWPICRSLLNYNVKPVILKLTWTKWRLKTPMESFSTCQSQFHPNFNAGLNIISTSAELHFKVLC